jgi:hypothetical protein
MKRTKLDSQILEDGKTIELYKGSFPGSRKKYSVIILQPNNDKPPITFPLMNKQEAEQVYTEQIRYSMHDYLLN